MNQTHSIPGFKKLSIRKRLGLGVAILVMPLLVVTFSGYLLFHYALEMMDHMYEEVYEEFVPITTLRERILHSLMPANDYLVHGDLIERKHYHKLRQEVADAFSIALTIQFTNPQKSARILSSHDLWKQVDQLSTDILALEDPQGNVTGAQKMEQLDWLVDQIHEQLGYVASISITELRTRHQLLHDIRLKISAVIVVFVLMVSAAVLVGSLLIRRWVIMPLTELETGAQQLADGDLDYRIEVNSEDEISRVAHTFNEMASALKHDREILHSLTIHDNLTGLLNRREFERLLNIELLRSLRHEFEFAVIMVDIDHFKKINDSFGHPAGDTVLKAVAIRISESLRPSDVLARYGGEEFIILLPQTGSHGATTYGQRLCTLLSSTPVDITAAIQPVVTVSAGIAIYPADHDNLANLINAADKALYAAKAAGRNRCYLYKDLA
jgi:diguanylate cyclase (GGDEF)-like protein